MKFEEGKANYKELVTDYSKAWFGDGLPLEYDDTISKQLKFPDIED